MPITMYDDVRLDLIPRDAVAVAGYINGNYTNYADMVKRWPFAHHLSISVRSSGDADCLDVEPGDATNDVVAAWVKRQKMRGIHRPCIYTSLSNAQVLLDLLAKSGIGRKDVRLWTAHYTLREHICGPQCGFHLRTVADGTQWTNRSHARSLDQSLLNDAFFGLASAPKPTRIFPKPPTPMPAWWWAWADWRRQTALWKHPVSQRPTTPPRIPLWAWGALIAYNKKYPIGK